MDTFINLLSGVAIIIFIISALPQIWTLVKHKSAKDISLSMSCLIATGNFLGLVRSIAIHDIFFLINYAFQLMLWLAIIVLVFLYRKT
jgi:uncharacterized protein with PQ loop repeat